MSLNQDAGSKFYRVALTPEQAHEGLHVSPLFIATLQNKIEAYASAVLTSRLEYDPDPAKQVKAILEYERLRNYVDAYEELLAELLSHPANQQSTQTE